MKNKRNIIRVFAHSPLLIGGCVINLILVGLWIRSDIFNEYFSVRVWPQGPGVILVTIGSANGLGGIVWYYWEDHKPYNAFDGKSEGHAFYHIRYPAYQDACTVGFDVRRYLFGFGMTYEDDGHTKGGVVTVPYWFYILLVLSMMGWRYWKLSKVRL